MNVKAGLLGCLMAVAAYGPLMAQAPAADSTTASRPLFVSLLLGTSGAGAGVRVPLNERWQLHAGATWMPFTFGIPASIGSRKVDSRFDNAVGAVHLLADYTPFLHKPGFRISAGLAYFYAMRSTMVLRSRDGYNFGNLVIKPGDIGELTARVNRQGFAPYLGLGLLKVYRDNRFSVSFDVGTYYLAGKLDVAIEDTGYLSGNEKNEEVLQENLKNYRWLPLLQVAFNYRFDLR